MDLASTIVFREFENENPVVNVVDIAHSSKCYLALARAHPAWRGSSELSKILGDPTLRANILFFFFPIFNCLSF